MSSVHLFSILDKRLHNLFFSIDNKLLHSSPRPFLGKTRQAASQHNYLLYWCSHLVGDEPGHVLFPFQGKQ